MTAYRFLSLFFQLPEGETLSKLTALERALNSFGEESARHIANIPRQVDLAELKIDHARLFVGPFQLLAPPYGSVYLNGKSRTVMADSTVDAQARYSEAGLSTARFKDAPDHIVFELEFMYYLIFKEIEAVANSDPVAAWGAVEEQKRFLQDHLSAWIAPFADAVSKNASTSFYRDLALATRAFVQQDFKRLEEIVAELSE